MNHNIDDETMRLCARKSTNGCFILSKWHIQLGQHHWPLASTMKSYWLLHKLFNTTLTGFINPLVLSQLVNND